MEGFECDESVEMIAAETSFGHAMCNCEDCFFCMSLNFTLSDNDDENSLDIGFEAHVDSCEITRKRKRGEESPFAFQKEARRKSLPMFLLGQASKKENVPILNLVEIDRHIWADEDRNPQLNE